MRNNNGKNSWFNVVKNAFKSPSTDNKRCKRKDDENEHGDHDREENEKRGKRRWIFGKHYSPTTETTIQHRVAKTAISICSSTDRQVAIVSKQPQTDTSPSNRNHKRAIAMAMASTAAAESAVANAIEIIHMVKAKRHDEAAIVIQTTYRGYLARRALLALKGVVKMQALIRGHNVRKRAKVTLRCIQSLVRVQALVCDQRRRLSCDATMSGQVKTNTKSISNKNNLELEELQALIQKAKQCSLRQGNTLAHILSQQIRTLDEESNRDDDYQTVRKDRSLCSSIKTVKIDTSRPHSFTPPKPFKPQNQDLYYNNPSVYDSPRTPSTKSCYQAAETPTSRAIYLHRMSLSENSCPLPRPSYMGPTQSAMARVRSHSTPRQRAPLSPNRQQASGTARKRLSFPVSDGGHY